MYLLTLWRGYFFTTNARNGLSSIRSVYYLLCSCILKEYLFYQSTKMTLAQMHISVRSNCLPCDHLNLFSHFLLFIMAVINLCLYLWLCVLRILVLGKSSVIGFLSTRGFKCSLALLGLRVIGALWLIERPECCGACRSMPRKTLQRLTAGERRDPGPLFDLSLPHYCLALILSDRNWCDLHVQMEEINLKTNGCFLKSSVNNGIKYASER